MDAERVEGGEMISVTVKHGQESLQVVLPASGSVKQLQLELQQRTQIVPRGQKLICKGKVLTGDMSLRNANVVNSSKIMLVRLQGFQQPSTTAVKTPPQAKERIVPKDPVHPSKISKLAQKSRVDIWKATGIIALRDSELQSVPIEVWTFGHSARILDLGGNQLNDCPEQVASLIQLRRLRLTDNCLKNSGIPWNALTLLKSLTVLALDSNTLTHLPPEIGQLSAMKHLLVSNNSLTLLPREIGNLVNLERLELSKNCLTEVPSELGRCRSLTQVDLSDNRLTNLPESVGKLHQLKILLLSNNALTSLTSEILRGCSQLVTLSLHGNEVTIENLRKVEGWAAFDERRKSKYSKQLDFNVMGSFSGFDEGADAEQWKHW